MTTSKTGWWESSRARSTRRRRPCCLHEAHRELEFLTLSKESLRFKTLVSQAYADLIYNGLWFSQLHQDLMAFTVSNQQYVSGTVRMKLYKGHAQVVGRKSVHSLYRHELATYEEGDQYDSSAALGFIKIHGLGQTTQAKHQMLRGAGGRRLELPSIIPPVRGADGGQLTTWTREAKRCPLTSVPCFRKTVCLVTACLHLWLCPCAAVCATVAAISRSAEMVSSAPGRILVGPNEIGSRIRVEVSAEEN